MLSGVWRRKFASKDELEDRFRPAPAGSQQHWWSGCCCLCALGKSIQPNAERPLKVMTLTIRQVPKQPRCASGVSHGCCALALPDFHAGGRKQDQAFQDGPDFAALVRDVPNSFPRLMSLPIVAVIEEIFTPQELF